MQKLLYGIGALLVLLVIVGFALPQKHRIEVNIEIDAQPATVFALVNDFRRFSHWAPWTNTDPNARFLYSGARRGEGAIMTWDGAIIGSGTQMITESRPYEHVGIVLSPGEAGEARSWFNLVPGVGTTLVSWGFEADYGINIVGRYFASMLGSVVARDYQDGLSRLKELAESLPGADFSDIDFEHIVVEATDIAYLSTSSQPQPDAISDAMGKAYFQVLSFIEEQGLQIAGAPLSITRNYAGSALSFDAGIPVRGLTDTVARDGKSVRIGATWAGPVVRVKHTGSYRRLTTTHRKIAAYLAATGIERAGAAWESYLSDPGQVAEKDLVTYVYYPIKVD
ncbi:MAG: SRPBCC family protein [Gammaproteobacteria bacterium]|nr:SRPBCC family protein [Gammaproteobacteria bacterium]